MFRSPLPIRRVILACATVALGAGAAHAETIWGVTDTGSLFSFDSATPGTTSALVPVTGLTAGHTLRGIDFRPANGQLYGLSNSGSTAAAQLYTINTATGAATAIGAGITLTGNTSTRISIDFNPTVDRIRVVTGSTQNFRLNPNDGAVAATDTAVGYAAGDPNVGTNPPLVCGIAYTNNFPGATSTTLYDYDFDIDVVSTIGSVGGTPTSPNTGQMFTVGGAGIVTFSASLGFDISGGTGVAYINADVGSPADTFYTVNLATGALTLVGGIGAGASPLQVLDIAAATVPEPGSLGLAAIGCTALIVRRRK